MGFIKSLFQSKKSKEQAQKYKIGMEKTRQNVFNQLNELLISGNRIDDDLFDEIEEIFIMADMGVETVISLVNHLRDSVELKSIKNAEDLREIIVEEMFKRYVKEEIVDTNLKVDEPISVLLFVGVNGVGKTTTIGKVAHLLTKKGKKVMMVAGDTFRAGAINQLRIWSERVGCAFYEKDEGTDPSSVMFDAINYAKKHDIDVLLCDTAGRLQNKQNLMKELEKIHKVIGREIQGAPHETLLVLDATTGQNGMNQARIFNEVTHLSGVVLTKLDGTAKGGIALAVKETLNIPIKLVGLGEKIDDLEYFDIEEYIYGLFSDLL
ncbi:MAG: signal recognition particle-docking protein FtsY [Candidatus Izemoplasmataceae bacterium]|jgi:fused signal recognition particle receptor|uniref:signal recognition particle-docking protein FtsY n=1 Tax=Liberiplasma polymorphum TaxID=3374570 RepID=UPI0037723F12